MNTSSISKFVNSLVLFNLLFNCVTIIITSQAYHQTYKLLKKEENEKHALRCTQLYTLSLANSLVDAPFWQCYNLDFRGRVYPVAPHFSQMLGDPARGRKTSKQANFDSF